METTNAIELEIKDAIRNLRSISETLESVNMDESLSDSVEKIYDSISVAICDEFSDRIPEPAFRLLVEAYNDEDFIRLFGPSLLIKSLTSLVSRLAFFGKSESCARLTMLLPLLAEEL